jgi:succinoglycan biosynthesis protein ExoU
MSQTATPTDASAAASTDAQVDVIIAAWNRADTIERAIRSVAAEEAVKSVIVVDDASTDDTAARAEALLPTFPKLKILRQPRNGGPSAARNLALAASDANWISILDGDDYMQPGRLAHLIAQSGDADFVADDLLQIDEDASPTTAPRPLLNIDASWPATVTLRDFVLGNISRRGRLRREMGFLKPIMRRSFLRQHHLQYDDEVRLGEDYLLYAAALAHGARFRLTPAAGYVAVMRSGSLSGRHSRQDLEALLRGDRRLVARPELAPGDRRALQLHCRHIDGKIRWLVVIEAVKDRDLPRFLKAFWAAPEIGIGLIGKLLEQVYLRGSNKIRRLFGVSNAG